jgi:hypothetical protein
VQIGLGYLSVVGCAAGCSFVVAVAKNMSLSAVGPQLSFVSLVDAVDGSGELLSAKAYNTHTHSDRPITTEEALIRDAVRNYSRRIRTGDTSVYALTTLILAELKANHAYKAMSPQHSNIDHVNRSLDIIEDVLLQCVDALTLRITRPADTHDGHSLKGMIITATAATDAANKDGMSINDVSDDLENLDWYFDSGSGGNFAAQADSAEAEPPTPAKQQQVDAAPKQSYDFMTDEWFCRALQHCLYYDYDSSSACSSSSSSPSSSSSSRLALPMHLASKLIGNNDGQGALRSPHTIRDRYYGRNDDGYYDKDIDILASVTSGGLMCVQLTGQSPKYSDALPNGLFVPVHANDYENNIAPCLCAQQQQRQQREKKKRASIFDSDSSDDDVNDAVALQTRTPAALPSTPRALSVNRVVLVDCNYLNEGEFGEGTGASESVRSIKKQSVMTLPHSDSGAGINTEHAINDFLSESNERFQRYIQQCISVLTANRVNLLVVSDNNVDRRIIHALRAQSIAVISVHSVYIQAFARLLNISPVDDILDIAEACAHRVNVISRDDVVLSISAHCQFIASSSSNASYRLNLDAFPIHDSSESLQYTFHHSDNAEGSDWNRNECVILRMQVLDNELNSAGNSAYISSVLFSAPTEFLALAIEDRFCRCFYRLRCITAATLPPTHVCIGAGLLECVAYAQFEQLKIATLTADGGIPDDTEFRATLLMYMDALKEALLKYVILIARNNGLDSITTAAKFDAIVRQLQVNSLATSPASVMDWIQTLSDEDKLALPCPLEEIAAQAVSKKRDHSEPAVGKDAVLDLVPVRIEGFSMCIRLALVLAGT